MNMNVIEVAGLMILAAVILSLMIKLLGLDRVYTALKDSQHAFNKGYDCGYERAKQQFSSDKDSSNKDGDNA